MNCTYNYDFNGSYICFYENVSVFYYSIFLFVKEIIYLV